MSSPEELAIKYKSPRTLELELLGKYVLGTQYLGRCDWFDQSTETPLLDRAPCVKYPIVQSAISSHVAFVLGEGRFPTLTSATSEDDSSLDEEWGLDEDDSDLLDRFVNVVLCRYAQIKNVARQWLADALAERSAAAICCVRQGRLIIEIAKASWCTPTLNEVGDCTQLEISYPYIETFYNDEKRQWDKRCMLYRRVIDAKADTVYQPAKAREDGRQPTWIVDKAKTKDHGLGFCPVLWYPCLRACSTVNNVDGVSIHEHQLREVDGLNVALSQKQRAAVVCGDPQMVEIGVSDEVNPAPIITQSRGGIVEAAGPNGQKIGVFGTPSFTSTRRGARKRGAGVVWRYPDKDSKIAYLTVPADALRGIDEHAKDLRAKIAEALHVVFIDPQELKSHTTLGGSALSFLFSRQLSFCDVLRQDFSERALVPLVAMLLRIVFVVGGKNARALYVPGVKKVLPILDGFQRNIANDVGEASGDVAWLPPRLESVWGPYFAPNEQDQLAVVQLVVQALMARSITKQMAVEKLRDSGVFDLQSAQEVVEAIDKETEKEAKAAAEFAEAMPQPKLVGSRGRVKSGGEKGPSVDTRPRHDEGLRSKSLTVAK